MSVTAPGMLVWRAWCRDLVLPYTDLVLWCIKHLDPVKYQAISGLPQKGAMLFGEQLKDRKVPFWLR